MGVDTAVMASFRQQQQQKLNFNAPLLSVRTRRPQQSAMPLKISSELTRESLREAGSVPFQWEQCPGRPKQNAAAVDTISDTQIHTSTSPTSAPANLSSSCSPSPSLSSPSSPASSSSASEKLQSGHGLASVNPVVNHEHTDVTFRSNNVVTLEELPRVVETNSCRLITWENQARATTIGASFRGKALPGDSNRWQHHSHSQSSKLSASIILGTCKTASLKMIKNAVARVCRKAGVSSLRTVAKAKRKVTPSRFLGQAIAAVHRNTQQENTTATALDEEEAAAVREVKAILQERLSQKAERRAASITSAAVGVINPKDRSRSAQCLSRQVNPVDEQPHVKNNSNWFQSSYGCDVKYVQKPSSTPIRSSNLSKRVGKTLWVDTKAMENGNEVLQQNWKPVQTRDQSEKSEGSFTRLLKQSSSNKSSLTTVPPVFPAKCQRNKLTASSNPELSNGKSSSTVTTDIGWPLGISGYPPAKPSKVSAIPRSTIKALPAPAVEDNAVMEVPLPPLPPSPAGGSWLRKALSNQTNHKSAFVNANPLDKKEVRHKRWEDMVRGSPRHTKRCSEVRKLADETRLAHVTKNHSCYFF